MGIWNRIVTWFKCIFMTPDEKLLLIANSEVRQYFEDE